MTADSLFEKLIEMSGAHVAPTIDTRKIGDGGKQASKLAFCFTATPDVIRESAAWGADVLITHEPTWHDHYDNFSENAVTAAKKKLLESTGMTVYRFHDHAHAAVPDDLIHVGFARKSGMRGRMDGRYFIFDAPVTPRETGELLSRNLGLKNVRIIGAADIKMTKAAMCLGACGDLSANILRDTDCEMMLAGEICEWKSGCFVRDAAQLGMPKAYVLMGHCGSEKAGMEYICELWNEKYGDIAEGKYFDTGELFV